MRRVGGWAAAVIALATALLAANPAATATTIQPSDSPPLDYATAIRAAYARSVLDVGVAYFTTRRSVEPNLNGLRISQVPSAPAASSHRLVSQLVAHASRRNLTPEDALDNQLAFELDEKWPCDIAGSAGHRTLVAGRCLGAPLQIPSLAPAPFGALELVAAARTANSPMSPFDLLTAAFETGRWRPAGVHPRTAEAARQAAAQMRHRSSGLDRPCQVTALWVVAAIVADAPDIRLAGGGFWLDGDSVIPLGALARHAARRGCQAAETLHSSAGAAKTSELAFWDPPTVLAISARAGTNIARSLGSMTAGTLRPQDLLLTDPSNIQAGDVQEPFRGCDAEAAVASANDIVSVRGFAVHECLADSLRQLLAAARSDGIVLGGWGWRSTVVQIELRQSHCPLPARNAPEYWTLLSLMPSFRCNPPTARPTTSSHEFGLAVDFTCGSSRGAITRTSRCYEWLATHAHRYGLYNLLSEPWHWSTTGR